MKFTSVVLLGLFSVAWAFPSHVVQEAADKAFSELEDTYEASEGLLHRLGSQLKSDAWVWGRPNELEGRRKCRKCHMGVTEHIMKSVVHRVKHICEETKCEKLKKHCEEAKEHPKVAFGVLLAMVRPMEKARAFCFGRGDCPRPHPPCGVDVKEIDPSPINMNSEEFGLVVEKVIKKPAAISAEANNLPVPFVFEDEDKCKTCIKGASCKFFMAAAKKIKGFCEKTECSVAKRHCAMAKKHPEIAAGVLLVMLRPAEWGCGYCFGSKDCSAPEEMETAGSDILGLEWADEVQF
ncbi:hypothetical protein SARC_12812 [Sphaeroforma arctica JP610]|uniref:Saposin B-type domain-containing protein n=1 Tax=Sphaeroforma arctica JP610 TaxID=667725 RepID=A0A0L0FD07_9EUKA|nr:hypothetical protein SARC_12812 [Sphaeroforma arctica JP610]KNC74649.1 hypothetical protein SARC_12812 [Sphaeroforma arctica JP610]|eukprot:XP_014148551.1 hypothetical protein SARC_12812 [Sphaeroforma arctica JP610]